MCVCVCVCVLVCVCVCVGGGGLIVHIRYHMGHFLENWTKKGKRVPLS